MSLHIPDKPLWHISQKAALALSYVVATHTVLVGDNCQGGLDLRNEHLTLHAWNHAYQKKKPLAIVSVTWTVLLRTCSVYKELHLRFKICHKKRTFEFLWRFSSAKEYSNIWSVQSKISQVSASSHLCLKPTFFLARAGFEFLVLA